MKNGFDGADVRVGEVAVVAPFPEGAEQQGALVFGGGGAVARENLAGGGHGFDNNDVPFYSIVVVRLLYIYEP